MAVIYCDNTGAAGNDADDGSTWALAKATLAAALTAAGAGGTVYVKNTHAESTAGAIALASAGTAASPQKVISVSDSNEPPTTYAAGATIATTGANSITVTGYATFVGVSLSGGSSTSAGSILLGSSTASQIIWVNGTLTLGNTNATSRISTGGRATAGGAIDSCVELRNVTLAFGHASQGITIGTRTKWVGGTTSGTVPTALVLPFASHQLAELFASGVNLANVNTALVNVGTAMGLNVVFENCKLHADVAAVTGTHAGPGSAKVDLVNCSSGDTNYNYRANRYQGNIYHETTIVRTGGASDGTTGVSRKMVSSANVSFYSPLELTQPIAFWNETLSSITVSVPVITDNVTLTDAEAWIEVEYLGTSGFPLSLFSNDRAASPLATPANQTTDGTSTWTTTGLTTPVKQTLSVTFTPAEKGAIVVKVCLAKASTTMYVDPLVQVQ